MGEDFYVAHPNRNTGLKGLELCGESFKPSAWKTFNYRTVTHCLMLAELTRSLKNELEL
jgi:hypothetical protein